ncbi:excisionase family DNA binding protein [Microbacterium natoriense]|uniref:Excisionase family DNA binding protein n=1 Tax=Microbacterium natoriense TaxID=284570 RepID=A0AAW8F347_9MICO|nr:helix-turn-helix domain-containing protein [Microbacterium natoriense]MDQ0649509.1 excisionase family DNA binding protein [Microbacterium natoriense]
MADRPLRVIEAAALAGVPRATFYLWIRKGKVRTEPAPGGQMRVRESEALRIRAWLRGEDRE